MAKKAGKLNASALIKKHGGESNKQDKLDAVRAKVREARDLGVVALGLAEELKDTNGRVNKLQHEELPLLVLEAGIDKLGLDAEGNMPAFDTALKPYYHANITQANAEKAFAWLEKEKHGDMIKNVFTIQLGMGDNVTAKELEKFLKKEKIPFERKRGVPWNTLTAFIKEQIEDRKVKPSDLPLDLLGAHVGKIVTMKPRKKD